MTTNRKSISRRDFLKLAMVGAGAGVLAACGGGKGGGGEGPLPTTAAEESGTLTVWGWPGTYEGMQSQIEAFNQKYPNLKVEIQDIGYDDLHTNLLNSIVAGTGAPDLCAIDVLKLTLYIDGLVDLAGVASGFKELFVPPTYSVGSYQGKFYGMATDSEPMGVFYRKDLFDQFGITEESLATWDDVVAAGNKVFDDSGGQTMMHLMTSGEDVFFQVLLVEQGFNGYYFNDDDTKVIVDDPKVVEAIKVLKRMWDGKAVSRNPQGGYSGDEATALLKADKVLMQIIGPAWYPLVLTGSLPEQSGKWRLMRAPAIKKGGPRIGYQYPTIFVMPTQSKFKGAAWELSKMSLLGEGAKALYQTSAVLPAYKPLLDEIRDQSVEYFGGQKINQLWEEIAKDTPPVFFGSGFPEAQTIMSLQLQQVLDGTIPAEEAAQNAAKEMREKLKKG